jgi:hypothetical protein
MDIRQNDCMTVPSSIVCLIYIYIYIYTYRCAQACHLHGLPHAPARADIIYMADEISSAAESIEAAASLDEFKDSLQNLLAALRRCSAAGIPPMAAEAARICHFQARVNFQDECACIELLCDMIQVIEAECLRPLGLQLDADFAAEAAMPAPPAAAATLATAVADHAGSGADKTLDHAGVAAADAGTPQTQGLPAAAVAAPPSPCSDSYSYYSSYSEDVEPAPAAAGASTRTWPAVQKKICKRSTATAVRGRARGCGRDPRAANWRFMLRVMHSRRAAGKLQAVTTAAGAAAVAASVPATEAATAAVERALRTVPMNPCLQGKLGQPTAPKTAPFAAAAAKAAPQKPKLAPKIARKPAAATAAPAAAAAALARAPAKRAPTEFTKQVGTFMKDPNFHPDLRGRDRFKAAVAATKAATAAARPEAATAASGPSSSLKRAPGPGCSKCRHAPAGCRACR